MVIVWGDHHQTDTLMIYGFKFRMLCAENFSIVSFGFAHIYL